MVSPYPLVRSLAFHDFYVRGDLFSGDERAPVGDDLADRRAALAEAGGAGGAVQDQRDQLAGETVDVLLVLAADADAELDFGRIGIGRGGRTEAGVDAEELGVDLIEGQAQRGEARANDLVGGLGL